MVPATRVSEVIPTTTQFASDPIRQLNTITLQVRSRRVVRVGRVMSDTMNSPVPHLFTLDDARRIAMDQFERCDSHDELHEAVFQILVQFADLYIQLTDPDDRSEVYRHSVFPGLMENLEIKYEERVVSRFADQLSSDG